MVRGKEIQSLRSELRKVSAKVQEIKQPVVLLLSHVSALYSVEEQHIHLCLLGSLELKDVSIFMLCDISDKGQNNMRFMKLQTVSISIHVDMYVHEQE